MGHALHRITADPELGSAFAAARLGFIGVTVVLAALVYYAVERPGIELGRRISGRLAPRITAEAI